MVVDPCYASWAAYLYGLWGGRSSVRTVLDVCCGTGLLAAELLALGYHVVGADASTAMLDRARARLGAGIELHRADLPDVGTVAVFDAVVSSFDGLNYLSPDALGVTIAALADRLRPGGWLVFDLHTDAMMRFALAHPVVTGDDDGTRFTISSDVDVAARTCVSTIELRRPDGEGFSERHSQFFHADSEVRAALTGAGLADIRTVEEYSETPVDAETLRATWIARRGC